MVGKAFSRTPLQSFPFVKQMCIKHGLDCKRDGVVIQMHSELRDAIGYYISGLWNCFEEVHFEEAPLQPLETTSYLLSSTVPAITRYCITLLLPIGYSFTWSTTRYSIILLLPIGYTFTWPDSYLC